MRLITLGNDHERAFRDFLDDFTAVGEAEIPAVVVDRALPYSEIVALLDAWGRGDRLQSGWVPATTWFAAEDDRLVAVANLRHRLTPELRRFGGHVGYSVRPSERGKGYATALLQAVKPVARGRGLRRLLVTCDPENRASARVIEKCGGRLENVSFYAPAGHSVCRYWIALDAERS
jgi:predicted acetyltransferase